MTKMRPTVLLVDDDEVFRAMIAEAFRTTGFDVVEAANGVDAFTTLMRKSIDVVLSDVQMKEGDGIRLLKAVQEHCPTVPVFLMTGNHAIGLDSCQGAQKVFFKPFDTLQIVRMLKAIVSLQPSSTLRKFQRSEE